MSDTENAPDVDSFREPQGVLVSRVQNPITVEYGDGHLRVSPRGTTGVLLRRLLPARLPAGLSFVPR